MILPLGPKISDLVLLEIKQKKYVNVLEIQWLASITLLV